MSSTVSNFYLRGKKTNFHRNNNRSCSFYLCVNCRKIAVSLWLVHQFMAQGSFYGVSVCKIHLVFFYVYIHQFCKKERCRCEEKTVFHVTRKKKSKCQENRDLKEEPETAANDIENQENKKPKRNGMNGVLGLNGIYSCFSLLMTCYSSKKKKKKKTSLLLSSSSSRTLYTVLSPRRRHHHHLERNVMGWESRAGEEGDQKTRTGYCYCGCSAWGWTTSITFIFFFRREEARLVVLGDDDSSGVQSFYCISTEALHDMSKISKQWTVNMMIEKYLENLT